MRKTLLAIITCFLSISVFAQKPVYTFTFKVYINEATAQYYGGHTAIEDSIRNLFTKVNNYYNSETRFNANYNFVPSAFSYYSETGNNQDVMNSIATSSPETSYNYRVVVSRSPYGGGNSNIFSDYLVDSRAIRFALNAESEWGQTLFGPIPTKILSHEIGHSRGAFDMYSTDVTGSNNQVNGWSYNYPVPSVMNYLYDSNANWDTYSIYTINTTGSTIHTATSWRNLYWSLFPTQFSISVKDQNGNPISNAAVTLYGVYWLSTAINSGDAFPYTTNSQGKVSFSGTNNSANPYQDGGGIASNFSNLLVKVEYQGNIQFSWMPVFDVQTAKILGQSEYVLPYTFNVSACTETAWNATTAYNGGATVQYNGMKYTAWYWTQNQEPDLNYGPQSSGKPWNQVGPCGSNSCTAQAWSSTTAYSAGAIVQFGGVKYSAWYWTQNQEPDLNYGPQSSGKPWNSLGTCTSRMGSLNSSTTMEVYPNPANETTTISFDAVEAGDVKIYVYDMMSKEVVMKETSITSGQNNLSIDVNSLTTGMYTISIVNGNDKIVKPLIIRK
jgi:chitodextrinase